MATAKIDERVMDVLREDPNQYVEKYGAMETTPLQRQIVRDALENPDSTVEELAEQSGDYSPIWAVKTLTRADRRLINSVKGEMQPDPEETPSDSNESPQAMLTDANEGVNAIGLVLFFGERDDVSGEVEEILQR